MEYKKLQGFAGSAAGGLLATIITLIVGVIGLQIVNSTLQAAVFTGLLYTVTSNIPVLFGVGLLAFAVMWAFVR